MAFNNKFIKIYGFVYVVIFLICLSNECFMDSVNNVNLNKNWTLTNRNNCKSYNWEKVI